MTLETELRRLKAVHAAFAAQGPASLPVWKALMADDFRLVSIDGKATPGLGFIAAQGSRDDALAYLWGIFDDWELVHYSPLHYLAEGDMIAVFGVCAYRHKHTDKVAQCSMADLWRFRDGLAVEVTDIFDTARAAAAAVP